MPLHDWTRVTAGTFHHFHLAWIAELRRVLNGGLLPAGYYALAEQIAGEIAPDVLTLQALDDRHSQAPPAPSGDNGGPWVAVAEAPPRVSVTATATEAMLLAARRRRLVIRHLTGDRIVALVEIVSPGNKERRSMLDDFVDKAIAALDQGFHLLIIDLLPPAAFDPQGIHGAIWQRIAGPEYVPQPGRPLSLVAYVSRPAITAYAEPLTLGSKLPDMPLFLDPGHYINVPLEATYQAAWEGVPQRWRRVIEGA